VAFGAALGLAAATSNLDFTLAAMIFVGAASVTFSASVQASLQLAVDPEMRGRVLSLYQILYAGTTPVGAILVGWLASTSGARSGLVLGSVAAILAGAAGLRALPPPRRLVHEALE
jgi:MFS family permease